MPLPSPASRTSNTRLAGAAVRSACERSALLSASISPAVPIEAVPDSAASTTETMDRIVGAPILASTAVTVMARKLSDRTLTVRLIRVVSCLWLLSREAHYSTAIRPAGGGQSRICRDGDPATASMKGQTTMPQEPKQMDGGGGR